MTKATRNPGGGRKKAPQASLPVGDDTKPTFITNPGLLGAIERLRAAEIRAAQDFELALTTEDPSLVAQKKKDWCDLVEQLRKVEASSPDIQKANAKTLSVVDVERETARMVSAFRVALEAIPRSMPQKLVGADEIAIKEALANAVNEALAQLHTGKWPDL